MATIAAIGSTLLTWPADSRLMLPGLLKNLMAKLRNGKIAE